MTNSTDILEGQLRECYGRVVYTHKTQEVCADILIERSKLIRLWQILLSALVTGGIISSFSWALGNVATSVSAILSSFLLALTSYTKDHNLGEIAQKHRQAAAAIWLIREKYLSLLTDLRCGNIPLEECRDRRDALLAELHGAYSGAPSTDVKAYQRAQLALKHAEDMTFSDDEIDVFLPKELKRKR
ncbi:MAG: SLATT domain-containing protein [Nitrospira sp. NTP1]|nr:SLATT domain-containing protein [Nitrospira sp. NTP1]